MAPASSHQDDDQRSALSADIHLLGDLLGQVLREQHGQAAFELEERVRKAAIARRAGEPGSTDQVMGEIEATDLEAKSMLIKAFSNYFQLVNIAEDEQRIRVLRQREAQGALGESIPAALDELVEAGWSGEQVRAALEQLQIGLVLTAHPTEAKRQELLVKLSQIADLVDRRERVDLTPREHERVQAGLLQRIEQLWQTRPTRSMAPSVMDEVEFGLYFLTSVIMEATVAVYEELRRELAERYPDEDWSELPQFLQFATWIGSDRDGHPDVTPQVTQETARRMRQAALEIYQQDLQHLRAVLTQSRGETGFSREILEAVAEAPELQARYPDQPYRQYLSLVLRRLEADEYRDGPALLAELRRVEASLGQNRGSHSAQGDLWRLIQKVRVFGLILAPMDIREDARLMTDALWEILGQKPKDQAECIEVLLQQLERGKPWDLAERDLSAACERVVAIWELVADLIERHGDKSVASVIGSMSSSVEDVLAMLVFARAYGVADEVDLVPLFETISDLAAAPGVMADLFAIDGYRRQVAARGERQQIMIGYSDSDKDGGYLAAHWSLHRAMDQLAKVCQDHEITIELFHGRGGSIGRGGGPSNRAILSQPPRATLGGRIRMTEQGEVIAYRYANPAIARRHLHQVFHAALLSSTRPRRAEVKPAWHEAMADLAARGESAYRALVYETHDFLEYWRQSTPFPELTELQIGSRPASRGQGGFKEVRAIPWVFSWMQCRVILPSWYGIGSALEGYLQEQPRGLERLRQMYAKWPFFRQLLSNAELDLAKVEMGIAERYLTLVDDQDRGRELFEELRSEYQRARHGILRINEREHLLDRQPVIQRSIERRNPYVDPLNFIQVALLQELRGLEVDDAGHPQVLEATLATIKGIAAGMKTTG